MARRHSPWLKVSLIFEGSISRSGPSNSSR
jgi:hypothetical protein